MRSVLCACVRVNFQPQPRANGFYCFTGLNLTQNKTQKRQHVKSSCGEKEKTEHESPVFIGDFRFFVGQKFWVNLFRPFLYLFLAILPIAQIFFKYFRTVGGVKEYSPLPSFSTRIQL
jgi:hypothetical protein